MNEVSLITALVVGIPIGGVTIIAVVAILRSWILAARKMAMKEKEFEENQRVRIQAEKLKMEEMHLKIIAADEANPIQAYAQIEQLREELRLLRQEVADLKANQQYVK